MLVEGYQWLIVGVVLAGIVRGFTGFGTAMVYLPIAGQILSPTAAITTMIIIDVFGPLPNVPRAIKDGNRDEVLRLSTGMIIGLPLGFAVLMAVAPEIFRYTVSTVTLLMLVVLITGWRYAGNVGRKLVYGTGAVSGFLSGASGLAGPPVILVYMSRPLEAAAVRANILLSLLINDFALLVLYGVGGVFDWSVAATGALLMIPYLLANMVGAALFKPEAEQSYRVIAYIIIAASALMGLPLLD